MTTSNVAATLLENIGPDAVDERALRNAASTEARLGIVHAVMWFPGLTGHKLLDRIRRGPHKAPASLSSMKVLIHELNRAFEDRNLPWRLRGGQDGYRFRRP